MTILIVGQKNEIEKGHPEHNVQLSQLGTVTELPMRDPLTMQPIPKPAP